MLPVVGCTQRERAFKPVDAQQVRSRLKKGNMAMGVVVGLLLLGLTLGTLIFAGMIS